MANIVKKIEIQKHGVWIKERDGNGWNDWTNLICSECNTKFKKIDWPSMYKFCPNCGSKMDGEKNGK